MSYYLFVFNEILQVLKYSEESRKTIANCTSISREKWRLKVQPRNLQSYPF